MCGSGRLSAQVGPPLTPLLASPVVDKIKRKQSVNENKYQIFIDSSALIGAGTQLRGPVGRVARDGHSNARLAHADVHKKQLKKATFYNCKPRVCCSTSPRKSYST